MSTDESSDKRISKEETQILINHALATGIKASKLAEELDTNNSRISEGKKGEWTLTIEQKEILIERYGQPLGSPGFFISASKYESVKDLKEQWNTFFDHHHITTILKPLIERQHYKINYDLIEEHQTVNKVGYYEAYNNLLFSKLKGLIEDEEFKRWYEKALKVNELQDEKENAEEIEERSINTYQNESNKIIDYISEISKQAPFNEKLYTKHHLGDLDSNLEYIAYDLFILATLHYKAISFKIDIFNHTSDFLPERSFGSPITDFVITGKDVLSYEPDTDYFIGSGFANGFKSKRWNEVDCKALEGWEPKEVSVYLNNDSYYAILLTVQHNNETKHLLIPKRLSEDMFTDLQELMEWFGLEKLPLRQLKENIAKMGGYIAGAEVI